MILQKKRYSERIIFSLFLIFQLLHENEVLQILKAEFPIPQTLFFFNIISKLFRSTFLINWTHAVTAQDSILCYACTYFISMLKSNVQDLLAPELVFSRVCIHPCPFSWAPTYINMNVLYIYISIHIRDFLLVLMKKKTNPLSEECSMLFKYIFDNLQKCYIVLWCTAKRPCENGKVLVFHRLLHQKAAADMLISNKPCSALAS